tara:strand:- start:30078 stop:30395 length:318 start_codon:yes stop_codon:yes gene_type:complete
MISLVHYQILSAILFCIGLYGALSRKSAILILLSLEIMLNAVNLNLIALSAFSQFSQEQVALGQSIVIFVITLAAAELALGVAIILRIYKNKSSIDTDNLNLLKW